MNADRNHASSLRSDDDYRVFWEQNLQIVESLTRDVQRALIELEKKSYSADELRIHLEQKINELCGIYGSYNVLAGREYVLRLRALYQEYLREADAQSLRYNSIHFLLSRIEQLRDESVSGFPQMKHCSAEMIDIPAGNKPLVFSRQGHSFGWLAFERLNSKFLLEFSSARLLPAEQMQLKQQDRQWVLCWRKREIPIFDLVQVSGDKNPENAAGVIVARSRGKIRAFAVDRIGQRFFAGHDIIGKKTEPCCRVQGIRGEAMVRGVRYLILE